METREQTSSSNPISTPNTVPPLKEIFRGDSELVDFFRFVEKEGLREKAHQMILERILKRRSN